MWLRLKENDGDQVREIEAFLARQNLSFEKMDLAKEILYRLDLGSKSLENLDFPTSVDVLPGENPYPLVSLEAKPERTHIVCGAHEIGPQKMTLIAGPCAVESQTQIHASAALVAKAGGHILRGGVFKPRTSPYAFQGLGAEGYPLLAQAARAHGLLSVSEVMDVEQIPQAAEYIDILQVGSRNMQNYSLLKALSKVQKPVLLKRGSAATLDEFLLSAEYILSGGNESVILCERGIRTFSDHQRHTFDVAIIPELKARTHLPVFADPSHATGKASMVAPMAKAALAAGADGIMVEAHPAPENALSDAAQSLTGEGLQKLGDELFALEDFLQS